MPGQKKEQLTRRIIELIFPLKEYTQEFVDNFICTIGRVMQAWANLKSANGDLTCEIYEECSSSLGVYTEVAEIIYIRKLTKANGEEATLSDQSEETIEKIFSLLPKEDDNPTT